MGDETNNPCSPPGPGARPPTEPEDFQPMGSARTCRRCDHSESQHDQSPRRACSDPDCTCPELRLATVPATLVARAWSAMSLKEKVILVVNVVLLVPIGLVAAISWLTAPEEVVGLPLETATCGTIADLEAQGRHAEVEATLLDALVAVRGYSRRVGPDHDEDRWRDTEPPPTWANGERWGRSGWLYHEACADAEATTAITTVFDQALEPTSTTSPPSTRPPTRSTSDAGGGGNIARFRERAGSSVSGLSDAQILTLGDDICAAIVVNGEDGARAFARAAGVDERVVDAVDRTWNCFDPDPVSD